MNPNLIRRKRILRAQAFLIHSAALFPAILLLADGLLGNLSVNPIQQAVQRTGRIAISLLVATLTVRPLAQIGRWQALLAQRRTLGLYTFGYALLHAILFLVVDYRLALSLILREFIEKPYLWFGVGAFAILLPLAITSFRYWMRKLGKNWKRLHRLLYLAAIFAVLHYGWAVKGDFLTLRGEVLRPWLYALSVAFLLAWRLWTTLLQRRQKLRRSAS